MARSAPGGARSRSSSRCRRRCAWRGRTSPRRRPAVRPGRRQRTPRTARSVASEPGWQICSSPATYSLRVGSASAARDSGGGDRSRQQSAATRRGQQRPAIRDISLASTARGSGPAPPAAGGRARPACARPARRSAASAPAAGRCGRRSRRAGSRPSGRAHLADGSDRGDGEGGEDRRHDRRRAGDHAGGPVEAEPDRGGVVAVLAVALAHAGEEEDGVVDREAEGDAEDRRGADRVDVGVAAERIAGGDLAGEGDDADRGADREQVEADREGGEQRRPQQRDQHQEGDQDDRADDQRQPRFGRAP